MAGPTPAVVKHPPMTSSAAPVSITIDATNETVSARASVCSSFAGKAHAAGLELAAIDLESGFR